jgi:hypothetical protein
MNAQPSPRGREVRRPVLDQFVHCSVLFDDGYASRLCGQVTRIDRARRIGAKEQDGETVTLELSGAWFCGLTKKRKKKEAGRG